MPLPLPVLPPLPSCSEYSTATSKVRCAPRRMRTHPATSSASSR
jgi:hypothetical protein